MASTRRVVASIKDLKYKLDKEVIKAAEKAWLVARAVTSTEIA